MSTETIWHIPDIQLRHRMLIAREDAGLTQQQIADALTISRQSVSNYEKGHTRPLRSILKQWSLVTRAPVAWLETGEAPPGGPEGAEVAGAGFEPATSGYQAPVIPLLKVA